jgi:hypothetical protein
MECNSKQKVIAWLVFNRRAERLVRTSLGARVTSAKGEIPFAGFSLLSGD